MLSTKATRRPSRQEGRAQAIVAAKTGEDGHRVEADQALLTPAGGDQHRRGHQHRGDAYSGLRKRLIRPKRLGTCPSRSLPSVANALHPNRPDRRKRQRRAGAGRCSPGRRRTGSRLRLRPARLRRSRSSPQETARTRDRPRARQRRSSTRPRSRPSATASGAQPGASRDRRVGAAGRPHSMGPRVRLPAPSPERWRAPPGPGRRQAAEVSPRRRDGLAPLADSPRRRRPTRLRISRAR